MRHNYWDISKAENADFWIEDWKVVISTYTSTMQQLSIVSDVSQSSYSLDDRKHVFLQLNTFLYSSKFHVSTL
jgi:hypothetical protein